MELEASRGAPLGARAIDAYEAFHRIREDRIVRTDLSRTNDLTSLLARSEGPARFSKRIDGRVSATWEVETKALDGEDQPNGLPVKATCRQNRRTKARCAIVALRAYPPTPLAETLQPSHHRC
jgi:hypothetical protein